MKKEQTYSNAIAELEEIIQKMQSNECSIDNLSELTSRSQELLKFCKEKLTKTDNELKKILDEISDEK